MRIFSASEKKNLTDHLHEMRKYCIIWVSAEEADETSKTELEGTMNNEQEPQEHPQRSSTDEERDYLVAKYCNDEED